MVQLGRLSHDISIFGNIFMGVGKNRKNIARNIAKNFVDNELDMFNKN